VTFGGRGKPVRFALLGAAVDSVVCVQVEPLAIDGAWMLSPPQHRDDRGVFFEWFRADLLAEATGRQFTVAQANQSVSRRGTLRGLHYADVPPGQAKLVSCPAGKILDVIVDIRDGSPTFGRHVSVTLDETDRRSLFIAEGLGHAFLAMTDNALVTYLVSTTYNPAAEHGLNPLDPEVGITWPLGELLLSPKDQEAPTLDEAREQHLLPSYDACVRRYQS
jgi:dTDP-4-dehydrorhamnose 3,5-epimerase